MSGQEWDVASVEEGQPTVKDLSKPFTEWLDPLVKQMIVRASRQGSQQPCAYMHLTNGKTERVGLEGGGSDHAYNLRLIALASLPSKIAFFSEVWTLAPHVGIDDPDARRVAMGEIRPSQLPAEKRGEALLAYAETAQGERVCRIWDIEPNSRGGRTLTEHDTGPPEAMSVRFWPIFVVEATYRDIEAALRDESFEPAELRIAALEASEGMTEDAKLAALRKAWAKVILMGGGGTSRSFNEQQAELTRNAVKFFAHRDVSAH